jgi:hypothetical protein
LDAVYEAQGQRRPNSRRRGRKQTSSEATLRLAVLKHVRNWSFEETEREVRANVVYRQFTRIGAEKVPDAKTMGRLVQALGPEVVQQIHQRVVGVAQEQRVVQGRKLRVDTKVCQVFCVNDQVLFLGWVCEGRGNIPSLAQRCRRILRFHDAALCRAGIRSGHRIVKWFKASRQ